VTSRAAGLAENSAIGVEAVAGGVRIGASPDQGQWDAALLVTGGHLLQSWRWGEFKARHGWRVRRLAVDDPGGTALAQVLYRHHGPVSVGYVPRGPAVGDRAANVMPLFSAIDRESRRQRALTLIVEPDRPLPLTGRYRAASFVRGPAHLQPSRTVKVPLLPDDELLGQMHSKHRYNIRNALRRGVVISQVAKTDENLDRFYELMQDTAGRNEFAVHTRDYYADFVVTFGSDAVLLFAHVDGELAVGAITARFGTEAIYMYGASSTRHRAHGAGFLIQYEAMRWARDAGCTSYDLWGIPAVDPSSVEVDEGDRVAGTRGEDWRGLYEFKVRFGGQIVGYPPMLERRYHPVLAAVARRGYAGRG